MKPLDQIIFRRNKYFTEKTLGKKLAQVKTEEFSVTSFNGDRLKAHLTTPTNGIDTSPLPGVIFIPGGITEGTRYDKRGELTAPEVAGMGFAVMTYDPSGRGGSDGVENRCGAIHQQELADVVRFFSEREEVDEKKIGLFSFSIGVTIAVGFLASYCSDDLTYLFDWEGPSNRFVITRNDTHPPFTEHPCSDETFWSEREPTGSIGDIKCAYYRYQGVEDHVQGRFVGHAIELVNLATKGKASCTQLNDNKSDMLFDESKIDEYHWISPGDDNKATILKHFLKCAGDPCTRS